MKTDAKPLGTYRNMRGWLAVAVALTLLLLILLNYALEPRQVARMILDRAGKTLGLEITATGTPEYGLRGTPIIVLRDLVAREPGAATPLLRARRLSVALPWATIRARGNDLNATRVELDAPVLDLPALQHWLATRPPSETPLPTLTKGLRVRDGRIVDADASGNPWRVEDVDIDLPRLAPGEPIHARLRGRYVAAPLTIPVDLAMSIERPEALVKEQPSGFAAAGQITIQHAGEWTLPTTVILSGPLIFGGGDLRITPMRMGVVARLHMHEQGGEDAVLPFAIGLHGPLRFDNATWTLAPGTLLLRGRGDDPATDPIPTLDAHGQVAFGGRLILALDGMIDEWPAAWPALPPPVSQSSSPLPFRLRYAGAPDLSDVASLRLHRDDTRFDGRFRLQDVIGWVGDNAQSRSLLPPLDGTLVAPELEIAGARLQGIEVTFHDPGVPPTTTVDNAPHDRP